MKLFNEVSFETPESVELEFTLAGIGNRAYALLIDYIVWYLILLFFLFSWAFLYVEVRAALVNLGVSNEQLELWLIAVQVLIYFSIYVGYFVFFETLWQGQTPGKRLAKIRVIRDDGRQIRLQQTTLRALLRPIDDTLFIGLFFIFFSKKEKRLGDLLAGTIVIQEERPVNKANFPISTEAEVLAKELTDDADISRLLPDDFVVIRSYLQRREGMTEEALAEISKQLANQVKDAIALDNLPKKVSANVFLEAVYLAYQKASREWGE